MDCVVPYRFEDGTISFLDVIALKHGFDALEHLTGQWAYFPSRLSFCCLCPWDIPGMGVVLVKETRSVDVHDVC